MPKEIVNNKIIFQNIYGRIAEFDGFLDQGVTSGDSPEFNNLYLTGDATIEGNLFVEGNTTLINTNVLEFEDNIILINRLETGSGVTLNQSGFEIERGSLENYRFIFNESDKTFKIGVISNLQAVATREDTPLSNGIMTWNNSTKKLDSVDIIKINTTFGSTTNSTSSTTGSLMTLGGLGIKKDLYIDGEINLVGSDTLNKSKIWTNSSSNILTIQSSQDIHLTPQTKIKIPFDKPITFGNDNQSIKAENSTNNIIIDGSGHIKINLPFSKRIDIPNLIPITFSTEDEKIFANGLNNMVITGSEHIELTPGAGKSVILPVDIPITFYNNNQRISSNLLNDLSIYAGNNIYITPGPNLNIQIPYDAHLKFGSGGNQTIKSDTSNKLIVACDDEIKLSASTYVKIPTNVPIAFGNYLQTISGDTFGNLILSAQSKFKVNPNVEFLSTTQSTTYANGSVVVYGGVGIEKNVNIGGSVSIGGNLTVQGITTTINSEIVSVKDNLFIINNDPTINTDGGLLIKRLPGNYAGIYYRETTDEITLAYTSNDPGLGNVIIDDYIDLRAKKLYLESVEDATDTSHGSLISKGGAVINKSLIVGNGITSGSLHVTGSSYINDLMSDYTQITTQTCETIRITNELIIHSDLDVINETTASFVLNGGMSLVKSLWVGSKVKFFDTTPSDNLTTGNLVMAGGISIKNTQNAMSITSGGGVTIAGGASIGKDVFIGGHIDALSINLNSTKESLGANIGSLITNGGITINGSTNSQSLTNGGALTIVGGASIGKDIYIGGTTDIGIDAHIANNLNVDNYLGYSGGGGIYTINNTSGSSKWYYFGQLNATSDLNYFDCEITNGIPVDSINKTYNLKVIISLQDNDISFQQSHVGNLEYNSDLKGDIYLYKEDTFSNYHIFYKLPSTSISTLRILHKTSSRIEVINEGTNSEPNGSSSGYTSSWLLINSSNKESNLNYNIGNLIADGNILKTADPIPIIGNNTIYTEDTESSNRNVGILFSRYQTENDSSLGDIINDQPTFTDIIPDQSTASSTQIKLSNAANNSDDFYNGWWIRDDIGQIRKIISYNGSQRVAGINKAWTSSPEENTNVSLYNFSYYSIIFDENDKKAKFIKSTNKSKEVNKIDYVDIEAKSLYLSDTTQSSNASSGSLVTLGGISINNTNNATSCTLGGGFTTLGGGAIRKNLYVGDKIGIGQTAFSLDESLHIRQQQSTIKLENNANEYSYIDFEESGNNTRFGLYSKISENVLYFTYNTTNSTPINAPSALTITSDGNIGIKTTSNISSALTLNKDNLISLNENNGYLGIIAGAAENTLGSDSNTCGASILLYGAESSGDLILSTGTIGNMNIYSQNELRLSLDKDGIIQFYATEPSFNSTTASFIINGGVSINNTENSVSYTQGGALTVSGGVSIEKDTYISGNLYVKGTVASDETIVPTINFSNFQNCTLDDYGNNNIILNGINALLSFYVQIYPTTASENCEFEFELPERISNLSKKMDLIATCNGYTDDTEIIPLFNTLCVGKPGTNKGIIKFQSVSVNLHHISIICRYSVE
jgi:hypothetical protein